MISSCTADCVTLLFCTGGITITPWKTWLDIASQSNVMQCVSAWVLSVFECFLQVPLVAGARAGMCWGTSPLEESLFGPSVSFPAAAAAAAAAAAVVNCSRVPVEPAVWESVLTRTHVDWLNPRLACQVFLWYLYAVWAEDYNADEFTVGMGCWRRSQPRLGQYNTSMESDWFC